MNPNDIVTFSSWSVITAIFIVVISMAYRKFTKPQKDESPSH